MIVRFGGVKGFIAAWLEHFDAAAKRAGSQGALTAFSALFRLIELCQADEKPAVEMTHEQLSESRRGQVEAYVRENPKSVLEAAASQGWEVVRRPA